MNRAHRLATIGCLMLLASVLLASSCATTSRGGGGADLSGLPVNHLEGTEAPSASQGTNGAPPFELESEERLFRSPSLDAFARRSLPGFRRYTLSNGIPFLFKESATNQVFALRVIVRGHALFTSPAQAGIEAVTLSMLTKGSHDYSYAEVQRLLYEKSAWMGPSYGSPDATSFGLTTLSKYLPELFDLFADSFLHPRWDASQFDSVLNDFKVAQTRRENDPVSVNLTALEKRLFAGHPYRALSSGVDDSLANIELRDVVAYYSKMAQAGRLFVVGVGDFDSDRLYAMLDATFGRLPARPTPVGAPPPLVVRPGLETVPFAKSTGLAYLLGAFPLPHPASPDYPAVAIALAMLDDLLYDTVRTQRGLAYGVSAGASGLAANYGTISVYKTSEPAQVKPLIDDSLRVLASGRCLAARVDASAAGKSGITGTGEEGVAPASYVPVAEALQFYRDQYLAAFYAGQETNRSIAAQIAASVIYRGDYRDYLLMGERLRAVTAESVVAAAKRYLLGAPTLWVAVGPEALLATIDRSAFEPQSPDTYERAAK